MKRNTRRYTLAELQKAYAEDLEKANEEVRYYVKQNPDSKIGRMFLGEVKQRLARTPKPLKK